MGARTMDDMELLMVEDSHIVTSFTARLSRGKMRG